jgi:hypothetical protein
MFNRIGSEREVSQLVGNNPQGIQLRGWPKNRWWNFLQTYNEKCKIENWKEK